MAFKPPPASAGQCKGISFEDAENVAAENKAAFDAFDKTPKGKTDPSKCKALLAFPEKAAIFWSSKMAIDADGPAAGPGRRAGSRNSTPDPDGTTQSSIFPIARDYPAKRFLTSCCRMAVVIFKDKITATICGDLGPPNKIGEASIQ
jgi:hypothetical protein